MLILAVCFLKRHDGSDFDSVYYVLGMMDMWWFSNSQVGVMSGVECGQQMYGNTGLMFS